ncbi:MAG: beta-ketoacyl-[acyl-carrier-protein] synthase family protein [Deltaproteobacteria bacterium]|nr:beta-ketoacyl-[acyl-carrier-protein] synthase family protein [Deltaproteobacteria bacterium]
MLPRRVAVTGMGVVSAIGRNREEFWQALITGQTGIGPVDLFDPSGFRVQIAAQVRWLQGTDYFPRRELGRLSRADLLGLIAVREAVQDGGWSKGFETPERTAVIMGAGAGGIYPTEIYRQELYRRQTKRHPSYLLSFPFCSLTDQVGNRYGLTGPRATVDTACSSTVTAIGLGFDWIREGRVDLAVTGGSESLSQLTFSGFNALKALDPQPCRPFDRRRQGLSLGEGAGVLILESLDKAQARGARIYGEVLGYGTSGDAHHITAPHPDGYGAALSMQRAISQAGITEADVEFISAHGTATLVNDPIETKAVKRVFGPRAYGIPITSIKSSIGHCLGAAGVLGVQAALLTIGGGKLPPTLHFQERDPACDLDVVFNQAREKSVSTVLCNAFAFGGNNSSLIVARVR